jgi:hypothetical protein
MNVPFRPTTGDGASIAKTIPIEDPPEKQGMESDRPNRNLPIWHYTDSAIKSPSRFWRAADSQF